MTIARNEKGIIKLNETKNDADAKKSFSKSCKNPNSKKEAVTKKVNREVLNLFLKKKDAAKYTRKEKRNITAKFNTTKAGFKKPNNSLYPL
jgi:hypothetical protein